MISPKIQKPLLFLPVIKPFYSQNPKLDILQITIKNIHFFKINFDDFSSIPGSVRVVKRNIKYLKATKHCRFKSPASFYKWNLASRGERGTKRRLAPLGDYCIFDDERKNPSQFLRKLTRNGLIVKYMSLKFASLADFTKRKGNLREVRHINKLKISNLHWNENSQIQLKQLNISVCPQPLKAISFFTHLESLFLEITSPGYISKTFDDVLETVSETNNGLKSLKIRMNFRYMNPTINYNFNKMIVTKFKKLKYLDLQLSFAMSLQDSDGFFTNLGCFPALRCLKLEVYSRTDGFKHSDAFKFVSQQQNLQTLKFTTFHMLPNEYTELLQNVQKMQSLTNLCIIETKNYPMRFDFSGVFETIEALKNLKSLKIHLGYYGMGADVMEIFFKILLNHPSLEKVDISLKMDRMSKKSYDFDEEFYQSCSGLKKKLRSFRIVLISFSGPEFDAIYERISKIVVPNGKPNKLFDCQKENF